MRDAARLAAPKRRHGWLVACALSGCVAAHAGAQQGAARFQTWAPAFATEPAAPSDGATSVPDSVLTVVGYQHWRHAAIGAGIGAALGLALGAAVPLECADCTIPSRGTAVLLGAGLGGAAGGVLGFLSGLATPRRAWVTR